MRMVKAIGARRGARRVAAALALTGALAAGGCGGDDKLAAERRSPTSITISAVISRDSVTVSPSRFGAGPIELLASNQSSTSQRIELRSRRIGAAGEPLAQSTGPINPGGTASLRANVVAGSYVLSASGARIDSATIAVGPPRDSERGRAVAP